VGDGGLAQAVGHRLALQLAPVVEVVDGIAVAGRVLGRRLVGGGSSGSIGMPEMLTSSNSSSCWFSNGSES
jgi:hypothetical protein